LIRAVAAAGNNPEIEATGVPLNGPRDMRRCARPETGAVKWSGEFRRVADVQRW
jgi:hypothetical protein